MKETKIEKLILDLSTRWEVSPEEVVDRLNYMNESEINKLINSMTKKFKNGGFIECLRHGNKIADCKCGDKIKAQNGTDLSRRDVINALRDSGFSRSQARRAYQNQKYALTKNGFSGDEMRQAARRNIMNSAPVRDSQMRKDLLNLDFTVEDSPMEIEDNLFTNLDTNAPKVSRIHTGAFAGPTIKNSINMPGNTLAAPVSGMAPVQRSTTRPDTLTFSGQNFDSAFANARKMGLSEFGWNGGRYSTALDPEPANVSADAANQRVINHAQNSAKNAKTGIGKFFKTLNAGLVNSTLDSPTMGLQEGGIISNQELLPINPDQYPYASKRDAIEAAERLGLEGANARRAYGDSKKFMRQQGLRGNDLRQAARYNLIDMAYPRAGMTPDESLRNLLNNYMTKISYE